MTRSIRWGFTALAIAILCVAAGEAQDFKPEAGYTALFNGKDLTGWHYVVKKGEKEDLSGKKESSDKRFEVKDDAIVANAKDAGGKGGIKDLYTDKVFEKDFHLKLEFRAAEKADSGVYIRGPQLQVRDFLRRNEEASLKDNFKNDDWNELDITVKGGEAEIKFNGKDWKKMKVPAKGPIGLQAESGKFEFRRVRAKEL